MNLYDFQILIEKAWCKDTAFSADQSNWTANNPSTGQCTVTSMLVYDYFGGKILRGRSKKYNIIHYWNEINGESIDLTKMQFTEDKPDIEFTDVREMKKAQLMRINSVKKRYLLLKHRFEKWMAEAN